ncbi:MAG: ABC transporter ATP-binding protein [Gemmatimonadota bacterium]
MTRTISTRGLTLVRGRDTVIDGLDWQATSGAIAWIVGENGSGKSTLLRALAGRLRPVAGDVRVEPTAPRSERTFVWYHPHMQPPAETRAADWARLVNGIVPAGVPPSLTPQLRPRQRFGAVSTGERKRLLLEALLRLTAPVYLLDEPLEHLSPDGKVRLTERLTTLAHDAVVVVATNQGAAAEMADDFGGGVLHLLGGGAWRFNEP